MQCRASVLVIDLLQQSWPPLMIPNGGPTDVVAFAAEIDEGDPCAASSAKSGAGIRRRSWPALRGFDAS